MIDIQVYMFSSSNNIIYVQLTLHDSKLQGKKSLDELLAAQVYQCAFQVYHRERV